MGFLNCFLAYNNHPDIFDRKITFQGSIEFQFFFYFISHVPKRLLLIFPKNKVFEKNSVRTLEVNRVVSLILNAGNTSGGGKKEKHTDFGVLSCGVESEGFEPSSKRRIL